MMPKPRQDDRAGRINGERAERRHAETSPGAHASSQTEEDQEIYRGILEESMLSANSDTEPISHATVNSAPK